MYKRQVYATGITLKNIDEARMRISASLLFGSDEIEKAVPVSYTHLDVYKRQVIIFPSFKIGGKIIPYFPNSL